MPNGHAKWRHAKWHKGATHRRLVLFCVQERLCCSACKRERRGAYKACTRNKNLVHVCRHRATNRVRDQLWTNCALRPHVRWDIYLLNGLLGLCPGGAGGRERERETGCLAENGQRVQSSATARARVCAEKNSQIPTCRRQPPSPLRPSGYAQPPSTCPPRLPNPPTTPRQNAQQREAAAAMYPGFARRLLMATDTRHLRMLHAQQMMMALSLRACCYEDGRLHLHSHARLHLHRCRGAWQPPAHCLLLGSGSPVPTGPKTNSWRLRHLLHQPDFHAPRPRQQTPGSDRDNA